ncbi:MAG: ankyrin repeat domain-containing protein, partial [Candidatus Accumulibacter sp.]|nr:ankyrin repeat domain-containing protein [Accumulibacter sp.]
MAKKPRYLTKKALDAFLALVRAGDIDGICAAVVQGFDLKALTPSGDTLLDEIVQDWDFCRDPKRYDILKELLRLGADARQTNFDGHGPLHMAAFNTDTELVRILLDAGADPNPYFADDPVESLYDGLEFDYSYYVWDLGGYGTATEEDLASKDAWLDFLDRQAIAQGKQR